MKAIYPSVGAPFCHHYCPALCRTPAPAFTSCWWPREVQGHVWEAPGRGRKGPGQGKGPGTRVAWGEDIHPPGLMTWALDEVSLLLKGLGRRQVEPTALRTDSPHPNLSELMEATEAPPRSRQGSSRPPASRLENVGVWEGVLSC